MSLGKEILTLLQIQTVFLEWVTLKMVALRTSETLATTCALT
jgi:hypothetical protein